ncbi:uncharacterized protein A4U43_C03F7600 [Asparagus officinalis]|uniref:Protein CROWDED NUCLEI 4 n=1 Tax=Asparagus officinalis TaxID=4686 RepID=A0A5P1F8W5_ASPOF|nr:uncharacterized protein A4U43_C03F7600 [Asparagus officinalis]
MANPRFRASPATPAAGRSPGSRVLETSAPANGGSFSKEEAIWRRLREAGFDEETVNRRDKIALVKYITKLESELYDYQHSMGLLILEKKELMSKYEQVKVSADLAEDVYKRNQAGHASALAEARKEEESLERALAIEKALHEMRAESAETKLAYETKLVEAREMMETAQKKLEEAESKLHSAESLHAEASRSHNTALRNLQDVEAREDDLRRRLMSFQSECDAKEKELSLQRQSLYDSQRILNQEQEKLLEGQALLNQREDYIYRRSKELSRFEKELNETKGKYEEDCRTLKEKNFNLDLDMAALATREEAVIERESQLDRRERELLVLQEKISGKEYNEIQRLAAEHEDTLQRKKREFEAELEEKRKLFEDEMGVRSTAYEERMSELIKRENLIKEKEDSIEAQLKAFSKNQEDLANRLKLLEEEEQNLHAMEKAAEMGMLNLQKEREEIKKMEVDLEKIKGSLEEQKDQILREQEKLELSIHERNELLVLETKLKEEIDSFRSKKMELDVEADKLKAEKEKFEIEWEMIDEKREELRKETERVAEESKGICVYLKNEHDSIKLEKDNLRNQFKMEAESLSREREEFMSRMEREHSDWVIKIQREREDFVKDINIQRKELENCIEKRREEVETYLREKEEAFEQERSKELQHISSQKEMIAKRLQHVASELKRLDNERMEIALDREQREREWSDIKTSVEVLNIQREKLQKQRELLHVDREEIYQKIQHLNKLEHLDIESENRALFDLHSQQQHLSKSRFPIKRCTSTSAGDLSIDMEQEQKFSAHGGSGSKLLPDKSSDESSPRLLATMSMVKKYARAIFGRSPEKLVGANSERNVKGRASTKSGGGSAGKENGSNLFKKLSLERNVEIIPEIEHKSGADKVITQLKEDGANGMSEENPSTVVNGQQKLRNRKKRHNDSLSTDHLEADLNQKQQKKAKQSGNDMLEENSSVRILNNGNSRISENPSPSSNLTPPCHGYQNAAQEQENGSAFLEGGQPANEIASLKEGDGGNHVTSEEVDSDDNSGDEVEEAKSSRLHKIWFFLTT